MVVDRRYRHRGGRKTTSTKDTIPRVKRITYSDVVSRDANERETFFFGKEYKIGYSTQWNDKNQV